MNQKAAKTLLTVKNDILIFISVLAVVFSLAQQSSADFDDLGAGARAIGLGGAYCAIADDPFGFYYNPAGPGLVRQSQLGADYGKLWLGLTDKSDISNSFVGLTLPFMKIKSEAVAGSRDSVSTSSAAAVQVSTAAAVEYRISTVHLFTLSVGWRQFDLMDHYQESSYYLGLSKSVNNKWAYGINLKALTEKYVIDKYLELSPVFDYGKKSSVNAFSVDAGVVYNIMPRLFAGISASDINQPDLGLSSVDRLNSTYRAGIAWKQRDIRWDADCIYRANNWYGATGFEKWFKKLFAIRAGVSMGGRNYAMGSLGFSFDLRPVQIDYVFQLPFSGIKDTSGSHRMSFVYKFGRIVKAELEPGSLEMYYADLKDEVEGLKATLSETESERKRLEEVLIDEATLRIKERIKAAKTEKAYKEDKGDAAVPAAAETRERRETRHVVRKGETLQSIAEKYYNESKYWNEIYQANRDSIGRGGVLKANQVLIIPPITRGETPFSQESTAPRVQPVSPAAVQTQEITPVKTALPGMGQPGAAPAAAPMQIKVIQMGGPAAEQPKTAGPEDKKEAPKAEVLPQEKTEPKKEEPKKSGPRKHIVRPGENLQGIAKKYYNDAGRWKEIYNANKGKFVGGQVKPGQEIKIP